MLFVRTPQRETPPPLPPRTHNLYGRVVPFDNRPKNFLHRARKVLSTVFPPRPTLFKLWGVGALLCLFLSFTVLNITSSLPVGLYLHYPHPQDIQRGTLATLCLTYGAERHGLRRSYLPKDLGANTRCPGLAPPLLKRILAGPGDTVRVALDGIFVNGTKESLPPPHCDPKGRVIPIQYGTHVLADAQYWLYTDLYFSYDSRIYGPVHRSQIIAAAMPLLVDPSWSPPIDTEIQTLPFRRADCSNTLSDSRPLMPQIQPLSEVASLDSLRNVALRASLGKVKRFRPPLSFVDLLRFSSRHRRVGLDTSSTLRVPR